MREDAMKTCYNCGNQLDDDVKFCLYCGAQMQLENNSQQYQGYGYDSSMYQNQMYGNPGYANGYYEYQQLAPQSTQKVKRPISKKAKVIMGIVTGLVIICIAVYFIFFAGKLTKSQAEELLNDYISDIEDFDIVGIVEKTVPDKVLKEAIKDLNKVYDLGISYSNLKEYMDDDLQDELEDALDMYNPEIDFSKVKVTGVEKFKFDNYMTRVNDLFMELTGEEYSVEEFLSMLTYDEMSMTDLEKEFEDLLEDYGIDIKDMYIVDFSFTVELDTYATGTVEFDSDELYMNYAIVYKYNNDWYLIPSVEGIIAPSLIKYSEKADKVNDVYSCKTIKTAVETALGNESIYEFITMGSGEYTYIYITPGKSTEAGDSPITIKGAATDDINGRSAEEVMAITQEEIGQNIGTKIPDFSFDRNNPTEYVAVVTKKGTVYVFISVTDSGTMTVQEDSYEGVSAGNDGFQICPNICDEYN